MRQLMHAFFLFSSVVSAESVCTMNRAALPNLTKNARPAWCCVVFFLDQQRPAFYRQDAPSESF
jgi:hypothetical protein